MRPIITIKEILPKEVLFSLRDEPEFKHNSHLQGDALLKSDFFLAIFVLEAEPGEAEATLKISVLSTVVLGLQKYSQRRLEYQGCGIFDLATIPPVFVEILREHYRQEERFVHDAAETVATSVTPSWTAAWRNGAGDAEPRLQFVITDPDAEELLRITGL